MFIVKSFKIKKLTIIIIMTMITTVQLPPVNKMTHNHKNLHLSGNVEL